MFIMIRFCEMIKSKVALVFITIMVGSSSGARILGYMPTPSYSHQMVYHPLWRELSLRGHQVVLLTTHPIADQALTNLTEIDLSFSKFTDNQNFRTMMQPNKNIYKLVKNLVYQIVDIVDQQLAHEEVQKLIKNNNEHFDVFIVEFLMPAAFAFAHRFNCPLIGVSPIGTTSCILRSLGSPTHPTLYVEMMLPFPFEEDKTLYQRVMNALTYVLSYLNVNFNIRRLNDGLIVKHFGVGYPSAAELRNNATLAFVNGDAVFHPIQPLVPTVIQIGGGSHVKNIATTPLSDELQKKLDDASSGFIYFSLGSNFNIQDMTETAKHIIWETFADLPFLILCRYDGEDFLDKPRNVITYKWLPQIAILQHPNIKLFINQGGLQSMDEAIHNYVPMIAMPFFMDQPFNANRMVSRGFGLSVDPHTFTKEEFKSKILEVIGNPKYRRRVKELADLAQDEPMTGLERAIWWTEYVIRHKGAPHLRSPAFEMPWYQFLLLDVIGVLLTALFAIIYLFVLLGRMLGKLYKLIFCTKTKLKKQ